MNSENDARNGAIDGQRLPATEVKPIVDGNSVTPTNGDAPTNGAAGPAAPKPIPVPLSSHPANAVASDTRRMPAGRRMLIATPPGGVLNGRLRWPSSTAAPVRLGLPGEMNQRHALSGQRECLDDATAGDADGL